MRSWLPSLPSLALNLKNGPFYSVFPLIFKLLVAGQLHCRLPQKKSGCQQSDDNPAVIIIILFYFSPSVLQFDDILKSVGEFGPWQRIVYVITCVFVIIPSGIQFAGGFFLTGTPKFQCVTPGVQCDVNKCCANCTKYHFTTFTSAVTEVGCLIIFMTFVCMFFVL